ncbi:16S rRNA (cytidine(1402)-2'-O)-methyltransferase [Verrucomicrobia bacterium]|nr:16S rRNA (cytidine(1402)-2'-O)-methyltransferase [Verrucomicrobiota bacterium]
MRSLDSDSSESATPSDKHDASFQPSMKGGTLYVVPTPIGNLEDITLRALRVLKECDLVLAEDTRHTGQLLKHFEFKKPMLSYHKFNEAARKDQILERLKQGEQLALVSDAGTPGISDPGQRIITETIAHGFRVEPLPGACAMTTALSACGLPTDEFHFIGFLDRKSARRRRRLEACIDMKGTLVLYESPHRIEKLLEELNDIMPDRNVVLARELTKKFEQWVRGTAKALWARRSTIKSKGEFVVLIQSS